MKTRQEIIDEAIKQGFDVKPDEDIKPGDMYVAMRNMGLKLMECREVKDDMVFPTNMEYVFNCSECVKVVS